MPRKVRPARALHDGRDDFELRGFVDDYLAAGRIPFSLIRWEMTGLTDEMEWLLADDSYQPAER